MHFPSFIQKLLTSYFRYTALVVALMVLGAGYGIVISNKVTAIQHLNVSDRARVKARLADDTAYVQAMQNSLALYKKSFSSADLKRLDRFLPPTSELPDVLLTMKNLVQSAGFDLQSLSVTPLTSTGAAATTAPTAAAGASDSLGSNNQMNRYQTIPGLVAEDISMTITGQVDYDGYKKFLNTLEMSEPLLDIPNVSFSQPTGDTTTASTYSFNVRTYYLPAANTTTP